MAYCARQFGDPLDFMRGPYSAKAIEQRTATPGAPHYPGWHSMPVAALYFLKAAELGATTLRFANLLLILSIIGSVAAAIRWRARDGFTALLLWLPLPFYAYSVAYGSVPIFIPLWWPHSWYNTRYGMEMLPVFALSLAFLVACVSDWTARYQPLIARWIPAVVASAPRCKQCRVAASQASSAGRSHREFAHTHSFRGCLLPTLCSCCRKTPRFSPTPRTTSGPFSGPVSPSNAPSMRRITISGNRLSKIPQKQRIL